MDEGDTPLQANDPKAKSRLVVPLVVLVAAFVVTGLVAFLATIDRTPPLTENELEAATGKWAELGPKDYDLEIDVDGVLPGVVSLQVRGGKAISMQRNGESPEDPRTWQIWSVEGQFKMLDRELDIADDPQREVNAPAATKITLRAAFDPEFGYPLKFRRIVSGGGVPDIGWTVIHFERR